MRYRYGFFEKIAKKIFRKFFPVPRSPWTAGAIEDICKVNLAPPERLVDFFEKCLEALKKRRGDNIGDYLEFGVFNGNSIGSMYLALQNKGLSEKVRLFGFDAFEGLPEKAESEDGGVWKKGFYSCSFEEMKKCLKQRGVDSNAIVWVKGWYDQTLTPRLISEYSLDNAGIIFIDCDTYSSSKTVLDFLAPLIQKPTIICFDDWKLNNLDIQGMGEYRAFNEFLEENKNIQVSEIKSYNRKSRSFIVELK